MDWTELGKEIIVGTWAAVSPVLMLAAWHLFKEWGEHIKGERERAVVLTLVQAAEQLYGADLSGLQKKALVQAQASALGVSAEDRLLESAVYTIKNIPKASELVAQAGYLAPAAVGWTLGATSGQNPPAAESASAPATAAQILNAIGTGPVGGEQ